jgi:hypothetical protein
MTPIHATQHYFLKIHFNIILPLAPWCSKRYLLLKVLPPTLCMYVSSTPQYKDQHVYKLICGTTFSGGEGGWNGHENYTRIIFIASRNLLVYYHAPYKGWHVAASCISKCILNVSKKRRPDDGLYQVETSRLKISTARLRIAAHSFTYDYLSSVSSPCPSETFLSQSKTEQWIKQDTTVRNKRNFRSRIVHKWLHIYRSTRTYFTARSCQKKKRHVDFQCRYAFPP